MLKSELLWPCLAANLVVATLMFGMGSIVPYMQLYTYRMSLASGDFQKIYAMGSETFQIKTSASAYICKDIAKRTPIKFDKPVFFESITQHCATVLNDREDSVAYALLGRLNAIAWLNTKDPAYSFNAERYIRLSTTISPQNENARKIIAEAKIYLQKNEQSQVIDSLQ